MWAQFHKVFFAMILLKLLSACAPSLQETGTHKTNPEINDQYFQTADGEKLPVKLWKSDQESPSAVVLALHGVNDYSNGYDRPATLWARQNVWTYAFDQRGFGETRDRGIWAGNDVYVDDAITAAKLLRKKHPTVPIFLVGESMGGAITILSATHKNPPPVDGYVLIAPAVLARDQVPWYQRIGIRLLAYTVPWWHPEIRFEINPSDNIEMLKEWSSDPLVIKSNRIDLAWHLFGLMDQAEQKAAEISARTLILYGQKEDVVPGFSVERFLTNLPKDEKKNWSLIKYENGYHMLTRDLNADIVNQDILDFILNNEDALKGRNSEQF